ncbi:twitchin isoform X3 [Lingula anatina]|uniref:non-specific serine/threonine protein kinase n=1 Tax=Lingula anatina TaxID=7574 RepID=A0A2R2MM72_LINAN|nr:twitchin isoform X3 [Lingula anatina]|eukprot:XP_023931299.1 twitchin isoform X3 [Lingula anatina]
MPDDWVPMPLSHDEQKDYAQDLGIRPSALGVKPGLRRKVEPSSEQKAAAAGIYEEEGPKRKPKQEKAPEGPVEGPKIKNKPANLVILEGDPITLEIDVDGKEMPFVRFFKGKRQLKNDARTVINMDAPNKRCTLHIKKSRFPDEGKYAVFLENANGQMTDEAKFTIFVKDPKDSKLDFRDLLKQSNYKKNKQEDEDPDWGKLKEVDKGRRPSQIEMAKINLKKTEGDSETEGTPERRRSSTGRRDSIEIPKLKKVSRQEDSEKLAPERRGSKDRRASLADVVPDWPTLKHTEKKKEEPDKFVKELEDQKVKEEDEVNAVFRCTFCKPNAVVRWYKNKLEIFHGEKYHFHSDGPNHKLIVKEVILEDGGKFTCQCNDATTSAWLYVEERPKLVYFTTPLPKTMTVHRKKNAILECFICDPLADVEWYKMGELIQAPEKGKYEIARRENRCILRILKVEDDDEAEYTCKSADDSTFCDFYVDEPEWTFVRLLVDQDAMEEETATFECEVNDPEADVDWYKGDVKIDQLNVKKYAIDKEDCIRRLTILGIKQTDEGEYCARMGSQNSRAELFVEPEIKFLERLKDTTVTEEQPLELTCQATNPHGKPVKWFKDGILIDPLKDPRLRIKKEADGVNKLVIESSQMGDAGVYVCRIGDRETKAEVLVEEKERAPVIDPSALPKEIVVKAGETIDIKVPYTAHPVPEAKWEKDGKGLHREGADLKHRPDNIELTIPHATRDDTGVYKLTLSNSTGKTDIPIKVKVLDRPSPPQGPVDIYSVYRDRCTLKWKPPKDDGGSPIKHYIIEKMDTSRGTWAEVGKINDLKYEVTGLTPGKTYAFRIRAANDQGVSEPIGTEHDILAKDPYDEPDAPTDLEVTDWDADHVELEWKAPKNDGGSPITNYLVEQKDKFSDWRRVKDVSAKDTKATVAGLKEGTEYTFRVMAVNKAGPSKPSEASRPVIAKPRRLPPRIDRTALSEIRIKVGQAFMFNVPFTGEPPPTPVWTRLTQDKKEQADIGDFTEEPLEAGDRIKIEHQEKSTLLEMKNCVRGDTGDYTLTVTNDYGKDTATVSVVVLGKPLAPEGPLEVSDVYADQVTLSWKPPKDDGGTEITGYQVEKMDMKRGTWEKVSNFVKGTECVVPKLVEGHDYKFRVMAENLQGLSEPLETDKATKAKNPYDVPGSPGKPKATDTNRDHITIAWDEPRSDGGAPITGYIVERKDPKSDRWTKVNREPVKDCEFTDDRVTAGREYEYRVSAVNKGGSSEPSQTSGPIAAKPMNEAPKIKKDGLNFPSEIRVRAGEPLDIKVPISGAPTPTVTWDKNGKGILPDNRTSMDNNDEEANFHIPISKREDTGKYTITATNKNGTDSGDINVIVLDRPGAPEGPLDVSDVFATSCTLKWKPPEDDGGAPITGYIVEQMEEGTGLWEKVPGIVQGTSMPVKGLTEGKSYKFRVKAENPYGVSEPLETTKSIVAKNPFDRPDAPTGLEIGDYDRFSVNLHWKEPRSDGGNPIKGYIIEKKRRGGEWEKANATPVPKKEYTVMNLTPGQEYQFRVCAVNDGGPGEFCKPTEWHLARDMIFAPDSPGALNVDKITPDHVDLSWTKPRNDGGAKITGYVIEMKEPGKDKWVPAAKVPADKTNGTVGNLTPGGEYQFRVRAENEAGVGEPSKPTSVIKAEHQPEKPTIDMSGIKDVTVKAGQPFKLDFPFTGFPKPVATWVHNDQEVDQDDSRVYAKVSDTDAVFEIGKAKREDTGLYKCTLKNPSGSDTGSVRVIVLDTPGKPEGPLTGSNIQADSLDLNWKPPLDDGGKPITNYVIEKRPVGSDKWTKVASSVPNSATSWPVKNLETGVPYEFRVMAENEMGLSEPLLTDEGGITPKFPFNRPDAPGTPKCTGTTEDSISLSWSPPRNDGGNPVKGYFVERKEPDSDKWVKCNINESPDTSMTVRGLTNGKKYEFRVCAVNKAGPSPWTETAEAIEARPPPVAPKIDLNSMAKDVKAKLGEPFKIVIPFTGGSPIPTPTVTAGGNKIIPGDRWNFVKEPDRIILECKEAEKIDNARFNITLTNEMGSDTASCNVTVVSPPGAPEGPLEVSDITPETCVLKWNPPKDDGGSPITNYIVEKKDSKSPDWKKVSKFVRGTEHEVMGLEEGHEYMFRVSAENEYGVSVPLETTKPIIAQHQYTVPDAPGRPKVDDVDADRVTLSWTRPRDDGGDKIQGYIIEAKEKGGKWKPVTDFPVKDLTHTVTGLPKDKEFDFRVKAKNKAGLSEPSDTSGFVTTKPKCQKPGAPGAPKVEDVGRTFVELSWEKPKHDGGAKIKGYTVYKRAYPEGDWEKVNDYPCVDTRYTVPDLPENSEYEFRVAAVNQAGEGEPSVPTEPTKVKEKVVGIKPEFVKKISKVEAPVGGEAKFVAEIVGKPAVEVQWFRNGIPIRPGAKNRVAEDDDGNISLTITDVEPSDAGEITCTLSNKLGKDTCSAPLEVIAPPKCDKMPGDQSVDKGDTLKLKIPISGKGPFDVKLKKGNQPLTEGDRLKITPFDDYIVVQLKDVDTDDTGPYKLDISNASGTCTVPFNLKVKATPGKPTAPLNVSDITKNACHLSWKPPKDDGGSRVTHYVVERKDISKPYWTTVGSFVKGTEFDVQGLIENNQYLFRVAAANENGTGEFLEAPNPITAKMPFDPPDAPGVPEVTEVGGDFVSLSWDKPASDGGGKILGYFIDKREAGGDAWLRANPTNPCITNIWNVPNLIEDREYEFRVTAVNEAGESKPSMASRKVKVKDPLAAVIPEFTSPLRTVQATEGKTAEFQCTITGSPKPEVTWFKGTRELFDSPKYEIYNDGDTYYLAVKDVFGEDADEYTVKATNRGGSRQSRADLLIKSAPRIKVPPRFQQPSAFEKGETIVIKLPFTGFPRPTDKWSKDTEEIKGGKNYDIELKERHAILTIKNPQKEHAGPYRLTLENDLGQDTKVVEIQINDAPDAPRFAKVDSQTDKSVLLSWQAPLNNGGSIISQYIIEKRELPSESWTRCGTCRFNTYTVENLSPDKEYQFRVIAENFYGRSPPSEPTEKAAIEKVKKLSPEDEFFKKKRGHYDGPPIDNYDKFYTDIWAKHIPKPVDIKTGSVYDYYDILEELGSGAFGVVHRCREKATGNTFVAKFIHTPYPLDKQVVRNEIAIMNNLQHPKLINLHDAFEDQKEMVLIMEFLAGGELFDRVAAEDYKMSEAEVINYMRQVLTGVKHMHEKNIVHLDIKPENVMCATKKSTDVKLIDFGLATKLNPQEVVKVTTATAEFAAPEIAEREPVGFYTDMWSVGVLAYVLLSGLSPFAGDDDLETLQNVAKCDWEFDEDAFKTVSAEGKDFIKKLLLRNPTHRMTVHDALDHPWINGDHSDLTHRISSTRYDAFRKKLHAKYGDWPAPRPAIGRIANFSSVMKNRGKQYQIYETSFDRREAAPRFIRKPRDQLAIEGQSAQFDCNVIAASEPTISWYFEGSMLSQSVKYMQKYSGHHYALKVSRCKDEDKGSYTVKAVNSYGSKDASAKLSVEAISRTLPEVGSRESATWKKREFKVKEFEAPPDKSPDFVFQLRPRYIIEGNEFKLICCVEATPTPTVQWFKDGREIFSDSHYDISYKSGVCELQISSTKVSDTGTFSIRAENSKGIQESSCKVTVAERPTYKPKRSSFSGYSSGITKPSSSRLGRFHSEDKFGSDSYSRTSKYSTHTEDVKDFGSSRIKTSRTVHSESYSSSSDSTTGRSSRRSKPDSSYEVSSSSRSSGGAPNILEELKPMTVKDGDPVSLECRISGSSLEITWKHNGKVIRETDDFKYVSIGDSYRLKIAECFPEDGGNYSCEAKNDAGMVSTTCSLRVKEE